MTVTWTPLTSSWHEGQFDVSFSVPVGTTFKLYMDDVQKSLTRPLWIAEEFGDTSPYIFENTSGRRCERCGDLRASVDCRPGLTCFNYAEAVVEQGRHDEYFSEVPGCQGSPKEYGNSMGYAAGQGYCVRPRDVNILDWGKTGSTNSGFFSYPNETLKAGTTYRGDTLLQGMERYETVRFNRFTGTAGYTEWNPHDGHGWLAYEPEYAKLDRKLRAEYADGQTSLVKVQFATDYPSGISQAILEEYQIHTTHMKMPWSNSIITWVVEKGTNLALLQKHHAGFTAYASGDYGLDGSTTFDFGTLFEKVMSRENQNCETEIGRARV